MTNDASSENTPSINDIVTDLIARLTVRKRRSQTFVPSWDMSRGNRTRAQAAIRQPRRPPENGGCRRRRRNRCRLRTLRTNELGQSVTGNSLTAGEVNKAETPTTLNDAAIRAV